MHREKASFSSWAPEAISRLNEAEGAWKDVLLGKRAHPGSFEQHMLPLDAIGEIRGPDIPPNINRYLMRATDTDVAHSESTEFIYSKLGPLMIFGFIRCDRRHHWRGTKISATEGLVE